MKKATTMLSIVVTIVLFSGCAVLDSAIGGVGATHTTVFTINMSPDNTSEDRNQLNSETRDIVLKQVRAIADTHSFIDKTSNIASRPRPIAYYETTPPWPCILKVLQTNDQLTVELWQYFDKRNQTSLYKEVESELEKELSSHFEDRLRIQSQRRLQ